MPQHDRNHTFRWSGPERGRSSAEREPFGARHQERDHPSRDHQDAEAAWTRDPRRQWRDRREQLDEQHSARDRSSFDDARGKRLMHWDDLNRGGDYFGTGIHHGAYSTQPGARASGGELWEPGAFANDRVSGWGESRDEDAYRTSGDYDTYGRSRYGAQSGYGRDYGDAQSHQRGYGQDFRERFAEERYGREPDFGYGFDQSPYKRETGRFRGVGPKGYERSDERLREIICERLTDEPSVDASEVSLEVKDKVVKLSGFVSDRQTKFTIEDLVERCGGVKDIDNQLRVKRG